MSKITKSGVAKTAAIFFLTVFATIFLISLAVVIVLSDYDVYFDNGSSLKHNVYITCVRNVENKLMFEYIIPSVEGMASADEKNYFDDKYSSGSCNFAIEVTDSNGNVLFANDVAPGKKFNYSNSHTISLPSSIAVEETPSDDEVLLEVYASSEYRTESYIDSDGKKRFYIVSAKADDEEEKLTLTFTASVGSTLTAHDRLYYLMTAVRLLIACKYALIAVCIVSFLLAVFLFVFLLFSAGHSKGHNGIYLEPQDRVPLDIFAAAYLILTYILFWITASAVMYGSTHIIPRIVAGIVALIAEMLLTLALVLTFATRAKYGKWWENTVIFKLLRLCVRAFRFAGRKLGKLFGSISLFWKSALLFFTLSLFEFVVIVAMERGTLLVWWMVEKVVLGFAAFFSVIDMKQIKKGAEEIASGNTEFKIETKGMYGDFKSHAESLNQVNDGIKKAVNDRMKSERFKTELITNVSHDLKTPLTSIVNYVDLMKKEDIQPEKAREYLEVLDRQSKRLQKLTIDLLEASKASTGNVQVNAEPTDVNVLLSQLEGEYAEKLEQSELALIVSHTDEGTLITVDGRLMWRVFDNLMNNVCKYAQHGTRVYVSAKCCDNTVVIEFKNISKYQLGISGDELIERFVRGDSSRNTEGSGLGLSIAQSLTELQGGKLKIFVDGDLFKAVVTFKRTEEAWTALTN